MSKQSVLNQWGKIPGHSALKADEILARVTEEQKNSYRVVTKQGELKAQLSGKLLHPSIDRLQRPVVGDWLVVRPLPNEKKAVVIQILARTSLLKRKAAGEGEFIQPLAANVDCTFIVTSMNRDFNAKRLDRYLTIAFESGSRACVLLTKSDLEPGSEELAAELRAKHNIPCLSLSALTGAGLDPLRALLVPGETVVFIGSSGVGKSTLLNALLGREEQSTAAVRETDDRGRHTTTSRRLIPLSTGALVIDTPGLREIQLGAEQETGMEQSFAAIEKIALLCKFTNCGHESEPGCAVKAALDKGEIEEAQFDNYLKIKGELAESQAKKYDKQSESGVKKIAKQPPKPKRWTK